jgi:hypothetical protein
MSQTLTEEQWNLVDEDLFAGNKLQAVMKIRQFTGLNLSEVGEMMYSRYRKLRDEQPHKFIQSHEEYWQGWYS